MHIKNVIDGIKNETIKVEKSNHHLNSILDSYEDEYQNLIETIAEYEGKIAGTIPLGKDEESKDLNSMLSFYKMRLDIPVGRMSASIGMESAYCFDCGRNFKPVLMSDNTIRFYDPIEYRDRAMASGKWINFDITFEDIKECEMTPYRKRGYLEANVVFPTGDVLLANYFRNEKLDDTRENRQRHGRGCINGLYGRNDLMQHMAGKGVGYGQMGNMSVSVYVNDSHDEIIISDCYGYDSVTDEEYDIEFPGFKHLGNISCSVWRWEATDKKTLIDAGYVLPPNLIEEGHSEHEYMDFVSTKVQPGTWNVKHYFDFMDDEARFHHHEEEQPIKRNPIYSHLKLMK